MCELDANALGPEDLLIETEATFISAGQNLPTTPGVNQGLCAEPVVYLSVAVGLCQCGYRAGGGVGR